MAHVLVIDAHPDPDTARFVHALAAAYVEGARAAGHTADLLRLADMEIPPLARREDWEKGAPPPAIARAQDAIRRADHLAILFPLWLGDMPALLKAFLEQTLRPGFAFVYGEGGSGALPRMLLTGKSAHIVVTMGMPAFVYRWYFGAHSIKSLKRNILAFVGVKPVRTTIIGSIELLGDSGRRRWLERVARRAATAR